MARGARLRGTAAGLVLDLREMSGPEEAHDALAQTLDERSTFLTGATISLEMGGITFSREDLEALLGLCARAGVKVREVTATDEATRAAAQALGLSPRPERPAKPRDQAGPGEITSPEVVESECGLVTGTVRSGHAVWHPGSVIVFGDVNPGAEIVAGGSVVVWGVLRGTVHAGAGGDNSATVCALRLEPTLLRIGNAIARSPDEPLARRGPELALARDGGIFVETWPARRPMRMGGQAGGWLKRGLRQAVDRLPGGLKKWRG